MSPQIMTAACIATERWVVVVLIIGWSGNALAAKLSNPVQRTNNT